MSNNIAIIERELSRDYMPALANILLQTPNLPALAFKSAFMETIARNENLNNCTRLSLFNCASSFAFLGILPGTVTGQAFMLPFKDNRNKVVNAVPVIGYKGYSTIAARSGLAIEGMCIRKDDTFKFLPGTRDPIHHEVNIEKSDAQITGAWSLLFDRANGTRFSHRALGIKQLLQIKAKSAGARKDDSPWNDAIGPGFEAMCEKSARRRQARSIPLNAFLMADGVEEIHDMGRPAWIVPAERDGQPVLMTPEGVTRPPPPEEPVIELPPKDLKIEVCVGPKKIQACKDIREWKRVILSMIGKTSKANISAARKGNAKIMMDLQNAGFEKEVQEVTDAFNMKE